MNLFIDLNEVPSYFVFYENIIWSNIIDYEKSVMEFSYMNLFIDLNEVPTYFMFYENILWSDKIQ